MADAAAAQTGTTIVRGVCRHDCPDSCAREVTVEGGGPFDSVERSTTTSDGRGANVLTNPLPGRNIGSAAFHDTLVQVEPVGPPS